MGACYSRELCTSSDPDEKQARGENTNFRILRFWGSVGPILLHYKWESLLARGDETDRQTRHGRLHARYAPEARQIIENFGGLFIKAGQAWSTKPEITPKEYIAELRKLQSEVPPVCWQPIRESLERDLGAPVEKIFDSIEQQPLGSASIGQAHRVVWRGQHAVVKVQYPGVRDVIKADLKSIEMLCRITNPEALTILKGVFEQFESELDYTQEHRTLGMFARAINSSPEFAGQVVVPAPIESLCKGNVIGMEFLPGPKLEYALRERLEALGMSGQYTNVKDMLMQQQHIDSESDEPGGGADGQTSKSPAVAGSLLQRIGRLAVGAVGVDSVLCAVRLASEARLRCRCPRRGRAPPTRDLHAMLRTVLRVHGYQIFVCGMFNCDPHPGNILLLPDGRIGLIDFGLCATVTPAERTLLAKLFIACADSPPHGVSIEADARVAKAVRKIGVRTESSGNQVLSLFPRLAFCKIRPEWLDRTHIKNIMEADKIVDIPVYLVMVARCAGLLRGLCLGLQENICIAEAWKPYAEQWLREHGDED